jgi:choline transport protein
MNLSAAVNFGYIILCSWEAFAVTFQFALYNGGPASMVYGSIIAGIGATATAMSLAELAAMYVFRSRPGRCMADNNNNIVIPL